MVMDPPPGRRSAPQGFYTQQALLEGYKVLGAAQFLGNPAGGGFHGTDPPPPRGGGPGRTGWIQTAVPLASPSPPPSGR